MKYGIGLDIGIASVGWAVVALDGQEMPCGILGMGARVFNTASLAVDRRKERGTRRRFRRHRHRNARIRALFLDSGLLSKEELDTLFNGHLEDIYALRVRALDEPITRTEFARVLIHLSQRRGFKSNRKNSAPKKDGELLKGLKANEDRVKNAKYRTVGEMFLKDDTFRVRKRNKGDHLTSVSREQVEIEVRAIFSAQRQMGSTFASKEFEDKYTAILLSQRSFDEGPGGNSLYAGNQIEKMVGICTFFHKEGEPRAAKATYSFEYFSLLEKVNHIRLIQGGESIPLTDDQRKRLIALAHETENLDFSKIRKKLSIPPEYTFNMVRYFEDSCDDSEKKTKFQHLTAYHQMRKAFDKLSKGHLSRMSIVHRNAIGTALTLYKTSARITDYLTNAGLSPEEIQVAEGIGSFSKFGHLSVRALDAITPYLEQGLRYNDACEAAGFQFRGHEGGEKTTFLHPNEDTYADITSPVARRAIAQSIKVINAIIRKQGQSPTFINIELAREMAKDFSERKQLEKHITENQKRNEQIDQRLRQEFGVERPTSQDRLKLWLYEQQGGVCPYSQKQISLPRLFEPNYAEIDHIVPYSISFDNTKANVVLVLAAENRDKGPRLPLQYLTGKRRDNFIVWVNSSIRDRRKRQLLLKEAFTDEDDKKFRQRNLQDTQTMAVFLMNYIRDNLLFADSSKGRKKRVTAVSGSVTSYLRARWGITKVRANGDIHHAVDALVIACATDGMIQQISRYSRYKECQYTHTEDMAYAVDGATGEVLKSFPYPWPQFHRELDGHLSSNPTQFLMDQRLPMYASGEIMPPQKPIFVSRMPTRKVTGAAHKDTIKSPRELDEGYVIVKRALTDLKLKNGEIENYYNPNSDRLLYEALKARLAQFGGDGKKAFAQPFHKPKSDGTDGPVVNKVKLCEPTTLNVAVHGGKGVADNDSMVRVDVFYVEDDGYYLVPIYVADTLKPELPNRACVQGKPYSQWKEMRDEDFIFSLYPNDLLLVQHKKMLVFSKCRKESTLPEHHETKSSLVYYCSTNISGGKIKCITHDNTYQIESLGVKTLLRLEKYTVDVLGEYHPVGKETRQGFTHKK